MVIVARHSALLEYRATSNLGFSALPTGQCSGGANGVANPDGQCIRNGTLANGVCASAPIFVQDMVPYTTGSLVGNDFTALKGIKEGTKLLKPRGV